MKNRDRDQVSFQYSRPLGVLFLFLAVLSLIGTSSTWAERAGSQRSRGALPDSRDYEQRYEESRRAFLDQLDAVRDTIPESELSPVTRLYDIAQSRARDGEYESAIQLIQRASSVLQSVVSRYQQGGAGALDGSLREMVERQYARLKEILSDSERAIADAGIDGNKGLLERSYSEAETAREAMKNAQWRQALTSVSRAMELARDAVREVRQPNGADTDAQDRLNASLADMDGLLRECSETIASKASTDNSEAVKILEQAQEAAARAHQASENGRLDQSFRMAHRAMGLVRIATAMCADSDPSSAGRLNTELAGLATLITRAEDLLGNVDNPTPAAMLDEARRLRDQALEKINAGAKNPDVAGEALKLIGQASEIASRVIRLATPITAEGAEQVLREFRSRYPGRAREVLRQYGPNAQAEGMLQRAEELADQAQRQIEQGDEQAALRNIRAATELIIQAIRLATASGEPAH